MHVSMKTRYPKNGTLSTAAYEPLFIQTKEQHGFRVDVVNNLLIDTLHKDVLYIQLHTVMISKIICYLSLRLHTSTEI